MVNISYYENLIYENNKKVCKLRDKNEQLGCASRKIKRYQDELEDSVKSSKERMSNAYAMNNSRFLRCYAKQIYEFSNGSDTTKAFQTLDNSYRDICKEIQIISNKINDLIAENKRYYGMIEQIKTIKNN